MAHPHLPENAGAHENAATHENAGTPPSEVAPFCAHIQSKKAYFLGRPPNTEGELLDASQSCWCRHTMLALGPDGGVVDPADCRAGRGCFESVL